MHLFCKFDNKIWNRHFIKKNYRKATRTKMRKKKSKKTATEPASKLRSSTPDSQLRPECHPSEASASRLPNSSSSGNGRSKPTWKAERRRACTPSCRSGTTRESARAWWDRRTPTTSRHPRPYPEVERAGPRYLLPVLPAEWIWAESSWLWIRKRSTWWTRMPCRPKLKRHLEKIRFNFWLITFLLAINYYYFTDIRL